MKPASSLAGNPHNCRWAIAKITAFNATARPSGMRRPHRLKQTASEGELLHDWSEDGPFKKGKGQQRPPRGTVGTNLLNETRNALQEQPYPRHTDEGSD